MSYSIETFVKDDIEYVKIYIHNTDFKQYLNDKLSFYPVYLATEEHRKWMKKTFFPVLIMEEVAGSKRLCIDEPISLCTYLERESRENRLYQKKAVDLLMEYIEECKQNYNAIKNTSA